MTDNLQPNVLTVEPDGKIGAFFSGGVQMAEGSAFGYTGPGNALAWVDAAGTVREWLAAELAGGGHTLETFSNADAQNLAGMLLTSIAGGGLAQVQAEAHATGTPDQTVTIINSDGKSSFLQLLSTEKRQHVSGWIDGRSSPPPIDGGTTADFTTSKAGTGLYTITFNAAFTSAPGIGLSTGLLGDNIVRVTAVNAGNFSVAVENRGTGAAADDFVGFVATG